MVVLLMVIMCAAILHFACAHWFCTVRSRTGTKIVSIMASSSHVYFVHGRVYHPWLNVCIRKGASRYHFE